MKSPENPYESASSLENRVQGEWESTQMKLDKVANFANRDEEKQILQKLIELGYENVGAVVDAIKNDKLDEETIREIFIKDIRVCVPIYTSAENYLYRHETINDVVKEKMDAGKIDAGTFLDEKFFTNPKKAKDLANLLERNRYRDPFEKPERKSELPEWYLDAKKVIDHEYEAFGGKPDLHDLHMTMLKFYELMKDELEKGYPMFDDWVRQYVLRIANLPDWKTDSKKVIEKFLEELEGYLKNE